MKVFKKTHPPNTKRRKGVIQRLEEQLKRGTKPATKGRNGAAEEMIPLTPGDIARITKEIETLKKRIDYV